MEAIRRQIYDRKLSCKQILHKGRPILSAERARILRGEYENFSMRRAFLIADSVGIDDITLMRAMVPGTLVETHGIDAAADRWGWISLRRIFSLTRQGRRQIARRAADGSR